MIQISFAICESLLHIQQLNRPRRLRALLKREVTGPSLPSSADKADKSALVTHVTVRAFWLMVQIFLLNYLIIAGQSTCRWQTYDVR